MFFLMKNRLVTEDGTRILTVDEYDRFIRCIPNSMKSIFVINMVTGLKYVELQQLYDHPEWYHKKIHKVILPKKTKTGGEQKVLMVPPIFSNVFPIFIKNKKPPYRSSWNKDLARWSLKININPKIGPKTPRKTIEIWMLKLGFNPIDIYHILGYYPTISKEKLQSVSFTKDELKEIEKKFARWGLLKRTYGSYYTLYT